MQSHVLEVEALRIALRRSAVVIEFLAQSRVKLSPPCHEGIVCFSSRPSLVLSGLTDEGATTDRRFFWDKGTTPLFLVLSFS